MRKDNYESYLCLGSNRKCGDMSIKEFCDFTGCTTKELKEITIKYGKTIAEYINGVQEFLEIINKNKEELNELSQYGDSPIDLDAEISTDILNKTMRGFKDGYK